LLGITNADVLAISLTTNELLCDATVNYYHWIFFISVLITTASLVGVELYEFTRFDMASVRKSIAKMNPDKPVPLIDAVEMLSRSTGASL